MAIDIEPIKLNSQLSMYSDAFQAGKKNLDTVLDSLNPIVQAAYNAMADYIADAEAERSAIAARKEEILEERRRQANLLSFISDDGNEANL